VHSHQDLLASRIMKKLLIIIGAGGLGKEVVDIVQSLPNGGGYDLAFLDDAIPAGTIVHGIKNLGSRSLLRDFSPREHDVCIAVGDPTVRKKLVEEIQRDGLSFATIVDPTAVVRPTAVLQNGVIVGARTFLSCNVSVGAHVVINPGVIVGHDVVVGPYAVVGGGALISGGVRIGEGTLIGAGASILNNTSVGDWCRVGMGAAVQTSFKDGLTVLGNPANSLPLPRRPLEKAATQPNSSSATTSQTT
jgi:sugar O-acyltransferase (sialic acid O-acetyltransferase NeuD family)